MRTFTSIVEAKRFYVKAKSLLPGLVYVGLSNNQYVVKYFKNW
jgi:hypothetical protein